jgi:hypothetical protein
MNEKRQEHFENQPYTTDTKPKIYKTEEGIITKIEAIAPLYWTGMTTADW